MKLPLKKSKLRVPEDWGMEADADGVLCIAGCRTIDLAAQFGTPLHVVHEERLAATADAFKKAFEKTYPGKVSIHYAFKSNPVPGVISIIKSQGIKAEVMSIFELNLALKTGFTGNEIIVNGPFKTDEFLLTCLRENVRFIIIDSLEELNRLDQLARKMAKKAAILLRINPDFTPKGMNSGTATGNRKGCAFGLDLKGGEADLALQMMHALKNIDFHGFHFHIGTGIRNPQAYAAAIGLLKPLIQRSKSMGYEVKTLDIGGGFASNTTREMTTMEMLWYQASNRLPAVDTYSDAFSFEDFAGAIKDAVAKNFDPPFWPELILEPGRCIASPNQFLLIGVFAVKDRKGVRKWIITNGGIGTVSMPTFYEFHEIFLCNDLQRPASEYITINGPGCFASDIVYNNKYMPKINPGEILAIMDSGAYFTSWESNFGHPRPAVIGIKNGITRVLRHRETIGQMMIRDEFELVVENIHQTI